MCKSQRGFTLPIVSAIIGFIAAMGSAIFPTFFHNSRQNNTLPVEVATSTTGPGASLGTNSAHSAPVSAHVKSSQAIATSTHKQELVAPVAQITATLDTATKTICDQTGQSDPYGISLWCHQLGVSGPNTPDQKQRWQTLETKIKQAEQIRVQYQAMQDALRQAQMEHSSVATQSQSQPQTERYATNQTYPIILSFTDNYGHLYKTSEYNGYSGSYAGKDKVTLHIGDTIRASVEAKDPQGRSLEYNWNSSSQAFNSAVGRTNGETGGYKYTSSNTLDYMITDADLKSAGETFRLVYQVRVTGSSYYRFGGGQYDDSGYIDYALVQ